ncbi:MAG: hypothetical protein K2J90_04460, partial [Lachnospiraceae bacterium]|nr:hypothetical protein [Lachnospiraceae bacterium]
VDSYVMIRLTDEYASYVDEIIDEYFDDYKFYLEFSSEWMTNELPADTKVEDLLKLRANVDYPLPDLEIFMKASQWKVILDEDIINMCKKLAEWGYRGTIHTTCYDEDIYYENKNNKNKKECQDGEEFHREVHTIFIKNSQVIEYK